MAKDMFDIALGADEDLEIIDGDFAIEESTAQHQRQLLLNNKGEFKQNPDICVGLEDFIDDDNKGDILREISFQFMKDGMEIIDLIPNPESQTDNKAKVFLNAYYK